MKKLTATLCLTLAVLLECAGMSESAEPIKGFLPFRDQIFAFADSG